MEWYRIPIIGLIFGEWHWRARLLLQRAFATRSIHQHARNFNLRSSKRAQLVCASLHLVTKCTFPFTVLTPLWFTRLRVSFSVKIQASPPLSSFARLCLPVSASMCYLAVLSGKDIVRGFPWSMEERNVIFQISHQAKTSKAFWKTFFLCPRMHKDKILVFIKAFRTCVHIGRMPLNYT